MPNLNAAIAYMETACKTWSLGYDQSNRWDVRDGGECDCSSLVITALKAAGFDVGGSTYTGNMLSNLTDRGWVVAQTYPKSASGLKPGDILLNDSNHVAMWVGGHLDQASIDERGRASGGQTGDQTGYETNARGFYVYAHGGWPHVLRYTGGQTAVVTASLSADPYNPNGYDSGYVKNVQARLVSLGYSVGASGADGILGADTYSAVKAYQKDHGLAVDGIPGPDTIGSLQTASSAATAAPAVAVSSGLTADGWWGSDTTTRAQEVLGTTRDGVVSSQDAGRKSILAACTSGWEFVPSGQAQGSQLIVAMQTRMGITADGIAGPGFVNALEQRFGYSPDGHLDGPSNTVKRFQEALNEGRF